MFYKTVSGHLVQKYSDDGKLLSQSFSANADAPVWENEDDYIIAEPPGMECEDVKLVQPIPLTKGYLGTISANPTAPTAPSLSFEYGVFQSLDLKDFVVTIRFPYPDEAPPREQRYVVRLDAWEAIQTLIWNCKKIEAIQLLRTNTNMGLKESKSVVESMVALDSIIQRAVSELKFPVAKDKEPVKEIGNCYKCDNRIEKPGTDFIVRGGEKIHCTEIVGCKLTRYFQNGDNCPLIEK